MIPGTKPFLKKILEADYNANIEVKEPPKPNSLNMFLKFRKEMMKTVPMYRNLPPQEGLNEEDPEIAQKKKLKDEAKKIQENVDFRILDADKDPETTRMTKTSSLDEEDDVMETFEQEFVNRHGDIYTQGDNEIMEGHQMVG